jgi:hypothetical protein
MTLDAYSPEIVEGLESATLHQIATQRKPAQRLSYLDVNQVGRVQASDIGEEQLIEDFSLRRAEQQLQHRGGVGNDHRASRSARSASLGDGLPE